ncbi:MAG: MotA/TolQ/ExbB proton channel family protein [Pontiellaceae bacterium]|nr:MotA/TolQ/ExbB proton channel family protein [Pontiellaceae bacterium]
MKAPQHSLFRSAGFILAVAVMPLFPAFSAAPADTGTPPAAAVLRENLKQIEAQASRQQETLERLRASNRAEVEQRETERAGMAKKLLNNQIELTRLQREKEKLQRQLSTLETDSSIQEAVRDLDSKTLQIAEQFDVYFGETFGHDSTVSALRKLLSDAEASGPEKSPELLLKRYDAVLNAFADLRTGAGTVRVCERPLRTAGGLTENVRLLAAGDTAYAYETLDRRRVGLAMACPEDASGLRWTEEIGSETKRQILNVFEEIASGKEETVSVPMDVTGQLRVDSAIGRQSVKEQFRAGGPVMFPLAGLALLALILIVERGFCLYGRNAAGSQSAERVLAACSQGDFETAERLLEGKCGVADRVLRACLEHRNAGTQAMEDAIQEQLLHQMPRLRRFLSFLSLIAAVAPLLGLLGTITGIIDTFGVIRSFGNANPGLMAGGISEALLTTAAGLIIAIPVLLCCGVLRGRMEKLIGDSERHAASLLNMLSKERNP